MSNKLKHHNLLAESEKQLFSDQFSGYAQKYLLLSFLLTFKIPDSTCKVSLVRDELDREELITKYNKKVKVGQWVLSEGCSDQIRIFGPYNYCEDAFKFGEREFGVRKWLSHD